MAQSVSVTASGATVNHKWTASGGVFAVLWMAGQSWPTALPGAPDGSPTTDYATFYTDNGTVHLAAALLSAASTFALYLFTRWTADALADSPRRSKVARISGYVAAALFLLSSVFPVIAVIGAGDGKAMWELSNGVSTLGFIAVAPLAWQLGNIDGARTWVRRSARGIGLSLLIPLMWWATAKLFLLWLVVVAISWGLRRHRVPSPAT